jgi:hypothetical protein
MSSPERERSDEGDIAARAESLAQDILRLTNAGGAVPVTAVQVLAAAVCRAYAAHQEAGELYPIFARADAATGTDVMVACSALLKAADLQVFELGMWSSWTGR